MVAALYVQRGGVYYGLPDVDPWDEDRDARLYAGPWPVVAHPPCARWGRYWFGSPSSSTRFALGDDGGCFRSALEAVRRWGGVLEHPEGSRAWEKFCINAPPRCGGWVSAGLFDGGWTCCVEQGHYGFRGRKPSWLYAYGVDLPSLPWGRSSARLKENGGRHGDVEWMCHRERAATPTAFRDLLLSIARTANPPSLRNPLDIAREV